VVGGYFPKAWNLKTGQESSVFSSWSLVMNKMAMARLLDSSKMSPFLLGDQPCLPDFHLFHILELGKTFSKIFEMPFLNLLSGDEVLQRFYDAMASRSSTQEILEAQAMDYEHTKHELLEVFGAAYQDALAPAKVALGALFGHDV
jgi:glutathione S-transferase